MGPGKVKITRISLLTSVAALPYTMRNRRQRRNSGETGSDWAGYSSAIRFFAALFDSDYVNEGICGRFGFVSTDGLFGYRPPRCFGADDGGSQLHVPFAVVFRGHGWRHDDDVRAVQSRQG